MFHLHSCTECKDMIDSKQVSFPRKALPPAHFTSTCTYAQSAGLIEAGPAAALFRTIYAYHMRLCQNKHVHKCKQNGIMLYVWCGVGGGVKCEQSASQFKPLEISNGFHLKSLLVHIGVRGWYNYCGLSFSC